MDPFSRASFEAKFVVDVSLLRRDNLICLSFTLLFFPFKARWCSYLILSLWGLIFGPDSDSRERNSTVIQ